MAGKKLNLKALASAPMAGFRTKTVTVEEWEGATVILREPSQESWGRWREILTPPESDDDKEPPKLSITEETQRSIRADAAIFIDVLLDEDHQPVFKPADLDEVVAFYGPVHARLLKQAIALSTTQEDAAKKSGSQKLDS